MKVRVVWIGKTKDSNLGALVNDFLARIRRYLPIEVTELRDSKTTDDRRRQEEEGEKILATLDSSDRVVLLDVGGEMWSSKQFAAFLGKHLRGEPRRLTFVIGGYSGIAESVKNRADKVWSLSPMTFTHEMARVLTLEQIYRALATLNNHPYSK
jgi:23S rRNA (pseudouridine1915-N3)-methyltransferase